MLFLILGFASGIPGSLHAEAPLKTGVAQSVGSVPDELKPDTAFNGIKRASAEKWGRVPNWLAGTWIARSELAEMPGQQPELIEESAQETWGSQVDARGNIWHRFVTPVQGESETDKIKKYTYWVEQQPLLCNEETFQFRGKSYSVDVDIKTGKIERATQSITITTFTPVTRTRVRRVQILDQYDYKGNPMSTGARLVSLMTLAQPLQQDLASRRKFVRFLKESQLEYLIPKSP